MLKLKYLALIPARGGSKGVKNKNIRTVDGKPLISYTINTAIMSECFEDVVVSTDSEEIAKVARAHGASVPFIRPAELADDTAKSIDVVIHALGVLKKNYDAVCLLQPTTPLRKAEDIKESLLKYEEQGKPTLVSVAKLEDPHPHKVKIIKDGTLIPFIPGTQCEVPRQLLPACYFLNGAIYVIDVNFAKEKQTFFDENTVPFIMPNERSVNIDSELDLLLSELLLKQENK
jgi:CMP-N-acetylneuraminic acid synthetase